jgi:hypothetical protein
MLDESKLEQVRRKAAARARAVRVGDLSGLTDPVVAEIERDYTRWLTRYYPKAVSKPMAFYHRELWQWVWQIELDKPHPEYDAFFGIWSRRCGKTTSGQLAIAAVGALKKRHYGWLLSRTQAQANQKLLTIRQSIGRMDGAYLHDYPHMAKARTEDGQNLGWNTTRLICSDGDNDFIVEAIGLDMAVRGANIEYQRPDVILPDDIDSLHDSLHVIEKNIETLTKSILLAGTNDKIVLGLQNLIHRDSIFAQIADGRAKFLMNRLVSGGGPIPALEGDFKYEERETPRGPRYFILSGIPTWPEGFGLADCEKELNDVGPPAFEGECQHNVTMAHDDSTFREFDPIYHCITVSEFMRYYIGNRAVTHNLNLLDVAFNGEGLAARLSLPRGECAMAQDWGNNSKHPVATRYLWRPGEGVPLKDSIFFTREMCWPTFPAVANDPRAVPSYGQLHKAMIELERSMGIASRHDNNALSIQFRLMSHERPEASAAYYRDYGDPLMFHQIDTKEAKEGILHLQELQHVNYGEFHPFRVDPRTLKTVAMHLCPICGWEHNGSHLKGRPRALYVVADGQGELYVDKMGKLQAKPAIDELGQARTRWEYPRHRPRETADGEEKQAAKRDDDIIDTDRALTGRVFYMVKRLSDQERLTLKYREIYEKLQGAHYPDAAARENAYMSTYVNHEREREEVEQEGKSWLGRLDGWDQS